VSHYQSIVQPRIEIGVVCDRHMQFRLLKQMYGDHCKKTCHKASFADRSINSEDTINISIYDAKNRIKHPLKIKGYILQKP